MIDEIFERLDNARDQLIDLGIGLVQLLLVFVAAALVARWLKRRIQRRVDAAPSPAVAVFIENSAVVGVYVVAITIVLAFWGLTWSSLLTALSIGTVAAAFGFQDLLRSLVGGVLVLIEQPFSLGDRVKIRDIEGRVENIDLRTTIIRADNGDRIVIPNAIIFSDPVTNRSPNRTTRVLIVSGIEGPPAELKQAALEALSTIPGMDEPPVVSVRTRNPRQRIRRALDVLPGEANGGTAIHKEPQGIGLRIAWTGDGDAATSDQVRQQLLQAFPGARFSSSSW